MTSLVREFHEAFGLPAPSTPQLLDVGRARFRARLIREEYEEVRAELERYFASEGNVAAQLEAVRALLKELADLRYVLDGMAVEFGIDPDRIFSLVHESNMSKLGPDGKPLRRKDGKVLKGPNYSPPDTARFFPGIIEGSTVDEASTSTERPAVRTPGRHSRLRGPATRGWTLRLRRRA